MQYASYSDTWCLFGFPPQIFERLEKDYCKINGSREIRDHLIYHGNRSRSPGITFEGRFGCECSQTERFIVHRRSERQQDDKFYLQNSLTKTPGSYIVRKQFAESIGAYAKRHKESFHYSGEHYAFLASFLDQSAHNPTSQKYIQRPADFQGVCVKISAEDCTKNQVFEYDAWDGHTAFQALPPPDPQMSHLVFLRGWQSREWLRVVGAQCNVDPEVFRRHLNFLDAKKFYDLPGLPSRTRHICQLRISTIIRRQVALTQQQVRQYRDADEDAVRNHQNDLRSRDVPGNSIVRRYAVHNETTSTIEQVISLSAYRKSNGGWVGM